MTDFTATEFIQAIKEAFKPTYTLFVTESMKEEVTAAIPVDLSWKLQIKPVPNRYLPDGATALLVPIEELEVKFK